MGKKFEAAAKQIDKPAYTLGDAMPLVKKIAFAKFDETVDIAIRLGVDPKHADQMVRGTVVLPHGTARGLGEERTAGAPSTRMSTPANPDRVSEVSTWSVTSACTTSPSVGLVIVAGRGGVTSTPNPNGRERVAA